MSQEVEIIDVWQTSPLQEGLFALHKLSQGKDPYHIQFIFRINGKIDKDLFKQSNEMMLKRYPNLRAAFFEEDLEHPIQIIPEEVILRWQEIKIENSSTIAELDEKIVRLAKDDFSQSFDLIAGFSFRFIFVSCHDELHYYIMTAHHIVIDGWSLPIFFEELKNIYLFLLKQQANLLPDPVEYKNYVYWLEKQNKESTINKWLKYLDGVEHPTLLSKVENLGFNIYSPLVYEQVLSKEESENLVRWCKDKGLTVNSIFLLAWSVVLRKIINQDDILLGLTISGRPADLKNVDRMIGLFINTIPCRVKLSPHQSVLSQAKTLQSNLFEMIEYGFIGLSDIQRKMKMSQLFDVLVIFQNTPSEEEDIFHIQDAKFSTLKSSDSTHYPLTLVAAVVGGEFRLKSETRSDLVETINSEYIVTSILDFLRNIEQYSECSLASILPAPPLSSLYLYDDILYSYPSIHHILTENIAHLASQEALVVSQGNGTSRSYSWSELGTLINKTAQLIDYKIKNSGLKQESYCEHFKICIYLPRNEFFIVSIFAALKLSYSIIPLDYSFPEERLRHIIFHSGAQLLITDHDRVDEHIIHVNISEMDKITVEKYLEERFFHPDQELYTIFTSGSTGVPKGVVVTHRNMMALMESHKRLYLDQVTKDLNRRLRIGHTWSFSFDASWQPLICFLAGHTLVLLDEETQRDPDLFVQDIHHYQIDFIETSPTMLKHVDFDELFIDGQHHLSVIGVGGEAINSVLWKKISSIKNLRAFNFYGPTETTVDAIVAQFSQSDEPVIGLPLSGIEAKVLDDWLQPCLIETVGELYIGGDQVVQGYLLNAELTATRFIACENGKRMYRSGDLVSMDKEGLLTYHGRSDQQVKIRGFRVEASDIEENLIKEPLVKESRVFPVETTQGLRLAAAVVINEHDGDEQDDIRCILSRLRARIPSYLIPHYIVAVKSFPMTSNGKLDVHALPQPSKSSRQRPQTEMELKLAKIIVDILSIEDINFLDVEVDLRNYGLDSIMSIQLSNAINQIGYKMTPRMLTESRTIRDLVHLIETMGDTGKKVSFPGESRFAFTPIIRWLVHFEYWQRFCQWGVFSIPDDCDEASLVKNISTLIQLHPMLRLKIISDRKQIEIQETEEVLKQDWLTIEDRGIDHYTFSELSYLAEHIVDGINPEEGVVIKVVWFPQILEKKRGGHLIIFISHLSVDGVSWRVILDDLKRIDKTDIESLLETTPFSRWSLFLQHKSRSAENRALLSQWNDYLNIKSFPLGSRFINHKVDLAVDAHAKSFFFSKDIVNAILKLSHQSISVEEALLTVLLEVLYEWYRGKQYKERELNILIDRENHGRDDQVLNEYGEILDDLSRTVGWFTTVAPVRLKRVNDVSWMERLKNVQQQLQNIPSSGLEYSLLSHEVKHMGAQIEFNYHGIFDAGEMQNETGWQILKDQKILDALPEMSEPLLNRTYAMEVNTSILTDEAGDYLLSVRLNMSSSVFREKDLNTIGDLWHHQLYDLYQFLDRL